MNIYLEDLYDDRYGAIGRYNIYKCQNCGFGQTFPGLKKHEVDKFYSKLYPLASYSVEKVKESVDLPNEFISWLFGIDNTCHRYIKKKAKVLDIGSGTGVSLIEIKKLGGEAYGIEPDSNAQRFAKKLGLTVFQGFITDNPFPHTKFDYITATQVIEHDPDPITFLKTAKRRLKTRGKIILSFPNSDSIYQKILKSKWLNWHVPFHQSFFTKKSLNLAADRVELKIKKIRTVTPNSWTIMQLAMLLKKPIEGHQGFAWELINKSRRNRRRLISILFQKILVFLILIPITIINRIIDYLEQGESILVFLEK